MTNSFDIIKFDLNNLKFEHHNGFCWKAKFPDSIKETVEISYNLKVFPVKCFVPDNLFVISIMKQIPHHLEHICMRTVLV